MKPHWVPLIALLVAGCTSARADDSPHVRGTDPAVLHGADREAANEYERAGKLAHNASIGEPVAEEVSWDEAAGFKQLDAARLPKEEAAKLAAITVPVLAFDDDALLPTALITHFNNWYMLAVKGDGYSMNVFGSRNARTIPGMEIPQAARDAADDYTIYRTHQVVTMAWRAFGVSYVINVECAKPMTDTRCTGDDFVVGVAEQLGVIGGQP